MGSTLKEKPSAAAGAAFEAMTVFTRAFLAASAPWDVQPPRSLALTFEALEITDADGACTTLGLQVWWLCRDEWWSRYETFSPREFARCWEELLKALHRDVLGTPFIPDCDLTMDRVR